MTFHLLAYLNVTEPFWGFCPISNGTYPVNQTCKNISGLHVLLDYPLKGTFSQIIALDVSAHFTSRSSNHDGKKQREQKESSISKFYKWIFDPKTSDCQRTGFPCAAHKKEYAVNRKACSPTCLFSITDTQIIF